MDDETHRSPLGHGVRHKGGIIGKPGLYDPGGQARSGPGAVTASFGAGTQFAGRAVGQNRAIVQHIDEVASLGFIHIGGTDHDAEMFLAHEPEQNIPEFLAG